MDEQENSSTSQLQSVTCTFSNFTTWLKTRSTCVLSVLTLSLHSSHLEERHRVEDSASEKWKSGLCLVTELHTRSAKSSRSSLTISRDVHRHLTLSSRENA